ncbi:Uncharacterized conserved protein, heparinase superfamily [Desulfomicrobium norvegicum]|uniref:Uncharacterized conserved protein, heparinase superfamily n=1 Tax=Desulfomicrobium norvegicum (strain DSM 1741 / NCIMB 8310) TaxID=52561 RepID=A0A8G2C347_DESNO|nr:heparinase II/III family protein [Desulfomicrobium norvegicum]SFL76016.1 Uncharacterized conserved protein, heparinase superfamily [Desulfomicrobium norvegicum]
MLFTQLRLLRTISHLTPRQIAYQLLRRLGPKSRVRPPSGLSPRPGLSLTPPLPRDCGGEPWAMTFIGVRKSFDPARFDWASMEQDKLWRYNQHYFDYLHEPGRTNGPGLIESWIAANPQGRADAWEPFPVSLRLVNWIKFFLSPGAPSLPASWLDSLALQARWLSKNIEYHLLANHYFKNAKALIFAGIFFDGPEARRWLSLGLRIVSEELAEQVLSDGGHFERSPMYHCMILEDCLDLLNLCRGSGLSELTELARELERVIPAMLCFAGGLTHPDGGIALFNDAALGIEPDFAQLRDYHERLGGEPMAQPMARVLPFPASGYFRLEPMPGDMLVVDCGPIGPDYQPGHAHCDTLSFELSLNGRRVIVDSGCSQYVDGEIRQYNRGSLGHNTLAIDGVNQSEVWGAHRVARRARPLFAEARDDDGALIFEGAHDGYKRLPGKPIHRRRIVWSGGRIEIRDQVEGQGEHVLELRLHVHPDWTVESGPGGLVTLKLGKEGLCVTSAQGDLELERGWYCPRFGQPLPCFVLCVRQRAVLPWTGGFVMTKES